MARRTAYFFMIMMVFLQGCNLVIPVIPPDAGQSTPTAEITPTMGFIFPPTFTPPPTEVAALPPVQSTPEEAQVPPVNLQPTSKVEARYKLQDGSPAGLPGFSHADLGCNWMGVGGQVFGVDSQPVPYLIVLLKGDLGSQAFDNITMTGTAPAWGPGGYEFTLADHPIESSGTLWMQVYDVKSGLPVTEPVYFTTYHDCSKNAIMINFMEIGTTQTYKYYFPVVGEAGEE